MDGFSRVVGRGDGGGGRGEGTRHSDVTAAELGWYSIACSPNPPTLLLALPETGVGRGVLVFAMPFHGMT